MPSELAIPISVDADTVLSDSDISPIPLVTQPRGPTSGQLIDDRYQLGSRLAAGGMGVVYEGRHVGLDQRVAIKFIRPELMGNEEAVARFINEARVAASLQGEHVARVMDVGRLASGEAYLVMEHLQGVDLATLIKQHGPLDIDDVLAFALEACSGLAEAHESHLVHRDVKPENLFLAHRAHGARCIKILDFGVSKRLDPRAASLTDPGQSVGSPLYMSPEQMKSPLDVDWRTDIWSMGVTLYELLTGALPFDGDTVPQICSKVLAESPRSPRSLRADIPPDLDAIVMRCLEKDRKARFDSVQELANALEAARLQTQPGQSHSRLIRREGAGLPSHSHLSDGDIPGLRTRGSWLVLCLFASLLAGGVAWAHNEGHLNALAPLEGRLIPAPLERDSALDVSRERTDAIPFVIPGPRIATGGAMVQRPPEETEVAEPLELVVR